MKYEDQLKDPRWQRLRLEKMQAEDWKCEICGDDETEFNVHHLHYREGAAPWEYALSELECLCRHCHIIAGVPGWKVWRWCIEKHLVAPTIRRAGCNFYMQEGIRQLCRLALIDPTTKAWLGQQNSPRPNELGEGGDLLGSILESTLPLQEPSARVAFTATLGPRDHLVISELDLDRPQANNLLVAQDLWIGLAAAVYKEQRSVAVALLHKPDNSEEEKIRLQGQVREATEQILTLQKQLNDV